MLPIFQNPASGMISHQQMLDVVSNNLANLNTPGFKAARTQFQELLYRRIPTSGQPLPLGPEAQPVGGPGSSPRLRDLVGAGVRLGAIERNLEPGLITPDGDPLHAAIRGEGFFIMRLADGSAAYTRDGSFTRDQLGRLVTSNGDVVLPETHIPADAVDIRIDSGGLIFGRVADEAGEQVEVQLGEIQLARFTNPDGLVAVGQSLFLASDASGPAQVGYPGDPGYGAIAGGAIESSNVELANEFTNLLIGQRAYSLSARALQTMDEMLSMANNLRR
jgi:flagellar basal-body rod protein FlgG